MSMTQEQIILHGLLTSEKFLKKSIPFLKDEYFNQYDERRIYRIIRDYYNKYNQIPNPQVIVLEVENDKNGSEESIKKSKDLVNDVLVKNKEPINYNWLMDKTEEFCKYQALYLAALKAVSIISGEDKNTPKTSLPDIFKNALTISFEEQIGHDYKRDWKEQFEYYHNTAARIPFSIDILNFITNNGIPEKTLTVDIAGVHVGKTLKMCSLAADFLNQGNNVLYITLEMSHNEIRKRIDANLLNIDIDDLDKLPETVYQKRVETFSNKTKGELIIKEYPTGSASTIQFEALLDEIRLKYGFIPDIIFVDYLNLCASKTLRKGLAGSYEYFNEVAVELRALAIKFATRVWTATQLNREGFKSSKPDASNVSQSFGIFAVADIVFVSYTNDDMKKLNQMMIIQQKNRAKDLSVKPIFLLGVDRQKMKIYQVNENGTTASRLKEKAESDPELQFLVEMGKSAEKPITDKFEGLNYD